MEPYKSESGSFIPSEHMLGERISIANFAPKIETFFPFFDCHSIFWRQRRLSLNQNGMLTVGVYDVFWSADFVWDCFKDEPAWQGVAIYRHLASSTDIICGCLTAIFHDHLSQKLRGVDVFVRDGAPTQISPQLTLSGAHKYTYSYNESDKLKHGGYAGNDRNFVTKSPGIAPVLWSILLAISGFLLCVLGGHYFDNGRGRLIGVGLFGIGSLLGAAGILPWGFWW